MNDYQRLEARGWVRVTGVKFHTGCYYVKRNWIVWVPALNSYQPMRFERLRKG